MKESCVINFASNHYIKGGTRLQKSLYDTGYKGSYMGWNDESVIGSPPHSENPYAFKVYCFEKALEAGHRKILWVDASIYAVKSIQPVWDIVNEIGYCKQYAGHLTGTWANDRSLEYFGITRDEAMKMEMHGNGGFFALDFDVPIAQEFFGRWKQAMLDGIFKGGWRNDANLESQDPRCEGHRHDMTCGSIIANQLKMKAYPEDLLMAYVGGGYAEPPESSCLYAYGNAPDYSVY